MSETQARSSTGRCVEPRRNRHRLRQREPVTAPTPACHATAAVDLLAQSDTQEQGGSVVAAQASVARAQVQALLAVAGLLAEQNALLAAQQAPTVPSTTQEPTSA